MNDGELLLRAILETPAEDVSRLVYADWLQENGHEARAEFIRVQCELEHCPSTHTAETMYGIHWAELCIREYRLLKSHGHDWLAGIGIKTSQHDGGVSEGVNYEIVTGAERGSGIRCDFARGFVETITCDAAVWLAYADAILAAHPVERVTLTTVPTVIPMIYGGGVRGYRFDGRHMIHGASPTLTMLEAEWPGITFTLPGA